MTKKNRNRTKGEKKKPQKPKSPTAIIPKQIFTSQEQNEKDGADNEIKSDVPQIEVELPEDTPKETPINIEEVVSILESKINISDVVQRKFLPKRPDVCGKRGIPIGLIINCCDVKLNSNMKIFMYDIELKKAKFAESKTNAKITMSKEDNLRRVLFDYFSKYNDIVPVFDGQRIIFTNKMLPIDNTHNTIQINSKIDEKTIECSFVLKPFKNNPITYRNIMDYIVNKQCRSDDMPQEVLRALNTIIKEMFRKLNLVYMGGKSVFNMKNSTPLNCGPYVLSEGYNYSFRPHQWSVRFNFDKTQAVSPKQMPLMYYLQCLKLNFYDFQNGIFSDNVINVGKKIANLRVQAKHLKDNQTNNVYTRKYTILGFTRTNAITEEITDLDTTVLNYYAEKYGITLKNPTYRLIKVNRNGSCIPVELLDVLPDQKIMNNDPEILQHVIKKSAIPASKRLENLRRAITDLDLANKDNEYLKAYMIQINGSFVKTTGRVLDGPKALFREKEEFLRGGKWDMRGKKFHKPFQSPINWAFFALGRENDYRNKNPLKKVEIKLPNNANNMGLSMKACLGLYYVTQEIFNKKVNEVKEEAKIKKHKELNMILCVVNNSVEYQTVKRYGDALSGIVTQCLNMRILESIWNKDLRNMSGNHRYNEKNMDQYLNNVILKINGKFGGTNWSLPLCNWFPLICKSFMVFGIDVTHPCPTRNDLSQSVAAIVGSVDNTASQYAAIIRKQISDNNRIVEEVIIDKEIMVYNLLRTHYNTNNQSKPKHLIFYRDGVSEGQFEIVFRHEIIAIQNACSRLDPDYQPKITYIVVQKRHKIRFFPENQKNAVGRSGNVPAGTVVDTNITHCREFDFYLCSHEGIQGTSKPAHYHVLYDDSNWSSDMLQQFSFYLCHINARCTRSISYPAPIYYAHLAAFRGRVLIDENDPDITTEISVNNYHNNKLFFL